MTTNLQGDADPEPKSATARALLGLCQGLLPVWGRHLARSRAESEVAVSQMLQAFSDIGPHINMAERQSQQINDALAQSAGGVSGLGAACAQALAPLLDDPTLGAPHRAAVQSVLAMVDAAVGALEQVARPFQRETQLVAEQVERMYIGFQYQDRISQMMTLLEGDIAQLQQALDAGDVAALDLQQWLQRLESLYAMNEQRQDHAGAEMSQTAAASDNDMTFF